MHEVGAPAAPNMAQCHMSFVQILGRSSVDIIKSGGYKLSALDIEGAILHHPAVAEAAVLGVHDEWLGQVVAALIYPKSAAVKASQGSTSNGPASSSHPELEDCSQQLIQQLTKQCQGELASYAVPRQWRILDEPLPRNAMGKVNKKELLKVFFPEHVAAPAS
eukprot:GHUV01032714.1.p1 GENE.GHUV01032714.1~~GHUV01032714.1.p1  ORF type:complete len:163 (-),score=56.15 GHUV01032714.1:267-755(-)